MKIRKLYLNWLLIHLAFVVLFFSLVCLPEVITGEYYVLRFHLGAVLTLLTAVSGVIFWGILFRNLVDWVYSKVKILGYLLGISIIPVAVFLFSMGWIAYSLSGIDYTYKGCEGDKVYIYRQEGCSSALRICEIKGIYYHIL